MIFCLIFIFYASFSTQLQNRPTPFSIFLSKRRRPLPRDKSRKYDIGVITQDFIVFDCPSYSLSKIKYYNQTYTCL